MTFILLIRKIDVLPSCSVGTDGFEGIRRAEVLADDRQGVGGHAVEDTEVDVVSEVGPDCYEEAEVGGCEGRIQIV